MKKIIKNLLNLFLIIDIFIIYLNGCSVKKYDFIVQNQEIVKMNKKLYNRFIEYWSAIREKRFDRSYKMELPYIKYIYDLSYYKSALRNMQVKKIEIYRIEHKGPIFIITMKMGNSWQKDQWIEVDGKYYHILKDPILFPKI